MPDNTTTYPKRDLFAEIAAQRQAQHDVALVIPEPAPVPERILPLHDGVCRDGTAALSGAHRADAPENAPLRGAATED